MLVLRNHVKKVAGFETVLNGGQNLRVMRRMVKSNSTGDAYFWEVVVRVPGDKIYQVAISEPFYKFDVITESRNYKEASIASSVQMSKIVKLFENVLLDEILNQDMLPIVRSCQDFDIEVEEWKLEEFTHKDEVHILVYGYEEAWDFGNNKEKAEKHLENLKTKNMNLDKEESAPDSSLIKLPTTSWICEDCKTEFTEDGATECPVCSSKNITDI